MLNLSRAGRAAGTARPSAVLSRSSIFTAGSVPWPKAPARVAATRFEAVTSDSLSLNHEMADRDKSPWPTLGLAGFLRAHQRRTSLEAGPDQATVSINRTLNTRPSSPLLCRRPTYTPTCCDFVPLSDSGRAFSVCSAAMTPNGCCRAIVVPSQGLTVISLCPRCNRCVSDSCPHSVRVQVHTCVTHRPRTGSRICHVLVHAPFTQKTRMGHTRATHRHLQVTHSSPMVPASAPYRQRIRLHSVPSLSHAACTEEAPGKPILRGWVTDRTLYPYP